MGTLGRLAVIGLAVLAAARGASAFINPKFTPKDILKQAEMALVLEFQSVDKEGLAVAKVVKVLKADANNPAPKELKIDLMAMGEALGAQGKEIIGRIAAGNKQAILFCGQFDTGAGGDEQAPEGASLGFLQFTNKWVILEKGKEGVWDMQKIWEYLNGVWAGSTDMFLRCLDCLVADPDFDVPVSEGVEWDANGITRFGRISGKVLFTLPVDARGQGQADLFVAAEAGDRLYRWNGKALEDVTAKSALTSKSQVAAWGDFDGDGKLDLASWDGKALTLLSGQANGTLAAKVCPLGDALKEGCLSLAALDVGAGGKAGLLAGTKGWPVLLAPQAGGAFQAKPLGSGEFPGKDLGEAGPSLLADLDGDGIPDLLQLFSEGGLFYKGKAPGSFAAPVKAPLGAGNGRYGVCLGDFDGDGLQDILIAGDAQNRLYQNLGGGKFVDTLGYSGSLEYISKPGGILAWSGDFNNDSKQDLLIAYGASMAPQLFFNRGFRAFGLTRTGLDLVEHKGMLEETDPNLVTDASEPQQAACLGDFNGDGALDMVLALASGDLVLFPRKVAEGKPLGVVISLPPGGPSAGPVSVSASKDDRDLGAWVLRQGEPGTVIGVPSPGGIQLKWTLPDGKAGEKRVKVKDGPVPVTLGKE